MGSVIKKKGPINRGPTLNSYCSMEVFLIFVSKLHWTACTTQAVVLHALQIEQLAGDKFQACSFIHLFAFIDPC